MPRLALFAAALLALPAGLWGHPGHGATPPESASHYVLEPIHAAPVIAIILLTAAVMAFRRSRRSRP